MPSLMDLGHDILVMIVDLLQDASPSAVSSIGLVNAYLRSIALYSQHRLLTFKATKTSEMFHRLEVAEKHELLPAIRRIEVTGFSGSSTLSALSALSALCDILQKMPGLRDFVIQRSHYTPLKVLKTLQELPRVRLHAAIRENLHQTRINAAIAARENVHRVEKFYGCPNLYSLDVSLWYGSSAKAAEDCLEITKPLKKVLLSCPNLRILGINMWQPENTCIEEHPPAEYCGLGFVDGERPPPLEELKILDYPFGKQDIDGPENPVPYRLKESQIGYPIAGYEQDYWADNFDWSQLKRLRIGDMQLALRMAHKLTALREVAFIGESPPESMKEFFPQVPAALESISVQNLACIGAEEITRHGATLRKLRLHEVEGWRSPKRRENIIDVESLRAIRDHCPFIEDLTLDIPRDGDWPYEMLDILASFPRLHTLMIVFDVGGSTAEDIIRPPVTYAGAQTVYKYLLKHTASRLPRLHVVAGSPSNIGLCYGPTPWWLPSYSTSFRCELSERDDEAARGVFSVTCTQLSDMDNRILRQVVETGQDGNELFGWGIIPQALSLATPAAIDDLTSPTRPSGAGGVKQIRTRQLTSHVRAAGLPLGVDIQDGYGHGIAETVRDADVKMRVPSWAVEVSSHSAGAPVNFAYWV
ncbi:Uu.00g109070.m01.CDS01 [Anthostomella pinea]|uniref:Uu.00g109070.m01.CDS01 n=1 Tax=Anthostomella pinea TaxID=933095 RepID=A0AAI8VEP0_9PEZI|nr:Uu.00g109070.m01.CDS01 [Anthostomella pinea]